MSGDVSALDLFGTDEPVADRRLLTAGPLSAILEDGNLRTICFAGIEVVRAINYLARDASWGTYKAVAVESRDHRKLRALSRSPTTRCVPGRTAASPTG